MEDHMRLFILSLSAAAVCCSLACACNSQAIQEAQAILDDTTVSFQKGTASSLEPLVAKTHLLEMKICQTPNDKQVCKDLVDSLNKEFSEVIRRKAAGLSDIFELINTHEKLVKTKVSCGM
jgi:hypothetical protein